jgi:hypothetical protein
VIYDLSKQEIEMIQRMREFKLARRSRLQHLREIIESPLIKETLYERLYADERRVLSMHARMV